MGGTVNIFTGIPFSGTMGSGVNTFTVAGDQTSTFVANSIITVLGGSPNGGYREVTGSTFAGGNTTVTSTPYSTGTAYPGPTNFSGGSNSVVWTTSVGPAPASNTPSIMFGYGAGQDFYRINTDGTYSISSDQGATWSSNTSFGVSLGGAVLDGISSSSLDGHFSGGSGSSYGTPFFAAGSGGTILVTTDANGTVWSLATSNTSVDLLNIALA